MRATTLVLLWLCLPGLVWADMACDGIDDSMITAIVATNFLSATTGTLSLWYKPSGTPLGLSGPCYGAERVFVDFDAGEGTGAVGIHRGEVASGDRVCATNYTTDEQMVETTYTTNAWTHLVWVHGGGNLSFFKDGVQVGSPVASGDSSALTGPLRICLGDVASSGANPAQGTVAEAAVFSSTRSAQLIANAAKSRLRRVAAGGASGYWPLTDCAYGSSGNGVTFRDRSLNGRHMTGSSGANATGLTCQASNYLMMPDGVE